jgi:hypothetical protein
MITSQHILMVIGLGALPHAQLFWAWIALCLALALHVADEAGTGFLSCCRRPSTCSASYDARGRSCRQAQRPVGEIALAILRRIC